MELAARQYTWPNSNKEEEMYKEMFEAVVANVPAGKTVRIFDPDVVFVGGNFLNARVWTQSGSSTNSGNIEIDFPNVVQIGVGSIGKCFLQCNLTSVNMPNLVNAYGGENFSNNMCTEIYLPSLVAFANHEFSYSSTLKTLRLPSVTRKTGSFFVFHDYALEDVYLPKMTLADLGGASYIAQQACNSSAVFHLKDGDYDYQGNPISA